MLSNSTYSDLFKVLSVPALIVHSDAPDFTIADANRALSDLLFQKEKDIQGKKIENLFEETLDEQLMDILSQTLLKKEQQTQKIKGGFFNGQSKRDYWLESTPFSNGETSLILVIFKPLLVEDKVDLDNPEFRHIVEYSTIMFYTHNTENVLTYVSPQSRDFLGCEPEEAKKRWTEFVTDHPVNKFGYKSVMRAIETGEAQPPYELELQKLDGEVMWVEVNEAPVKQDGKVIGIVGSLTDITKRKFYKARIEESLERYEYVSMAMGDAVYDWDVAANHLDWVKTYQVLFGHKPKNNYPIEEWEKNIHPDDREKSAKSLNAALNNPTKSSWSAEYRYMRADGTAAYVEENGFILRDETGKAVRMIGALRDVSETKELKMMLERAQKMARIGAWEVDMLENKIYWSPITREIHELDEESEMKIEDGIRFYKEGKSREMIEKAVKDCLENGTPWDEELQIITAKGNEKWVKTIGEAEFLDGKCVRLYGSFQDIDERKRAEQKLKSVADNIPGAIFQYHLSSGGEHKITLLSEGAYDLWGLSPEEAMADTDLIWSQFHQEDVEMVKRSIIHSAETLERWNCRWRSHHPDGSLRWHEGSGTPQKLPNGDTLWDSLVLDVTAEQETRLALMKSYQEKTDILESIGDGFFTVDKKWVVTYWNKEAEKLLNVARNEIVGYNLWEKFPEAVDMKFYSQYHLAMQKQEAKHFEEYFHPLEMWFEVSAYPSANTLTVYFKDITDRKLANEQLNRLNRELELRAEELERSNEELEQFAYVASHDLQEPLRMITSFLTQLKKKYNNQLDDKAQRYIHFAVDGAQRMRQIILDLLNYSRVGRDRLKFEETDVNVILEEVCRLKQDMIEKNKASIKWENIPVIQAAPTAISLVFQNLVSNGIKYQPKGQKPEVKISSIENSTHWEFSVSDNGIGIDPQFQENIFTIFQRLHTREEYSGTGIGLAIAKKIVEKHGGSIWVESSEGEGSIFRFTISKGNSQDSEITKKE